jgi:copper transport protein
MDGEPLALLLLAGAKWVTYVGLIGLTGAVSIRWLLTSAADTAESPALEVERRLTVLGGGAAVVFVVGTAARLYAQTWSVFGIDEPVTLELIRVVGIDSRWGGRWQPQAGLAALAALAAGVWRRQPRAAWWIAAAAVTGAWMTLPLTGHAMSLDTRVPWLAQAAHGIAAGVWIGALAGLAAVAAGLARQPAGDGRVADLARRFSPVAQAAVGAIALSGLVTAFLYVGTLGNLWTTGYGRVLLLKVVLFLATGCVGARNWRMLLPRLGDGAGTRALRRSVRLELCLAAAVLLATAVLVHLAMPREME